VLPEREREAIRDLLAGLERDVDLRLELGPAHHPVTVIAAGREIDFGEETRKLVEAVAAESERVRLEVVETTTANGRRFPRLTIGERVRYDGLPWGYELSSLVYGIVEPARGPSLSDTSRAALAPIDRDVEIEVYVTPT
jgi:alkyl hydroperoxide reductase subunit AhpF